MTVRGDWGRGSIMLILPSEGSMRPMLSNEDCPNSYSGCSTYWLWNHGHLI